MVQSLISSEILYPDSDGQPMVENTLQYRWRVRLVTNLKQLLKEQVAFVAGDLLWYPVQVTQPPAPSQAPDEMVVLGRLDGDRGSYKPWEEDNVTQQVVFEILSPDNSVREMLARQVLWKIWRARDVLLRSRLLRFLGDGFDLPQRKTLRRLCR